MSFFIANVSDLPDISSADCMEDGTVKRVVTETGGREIVLIDSITMVEIGDSGQVIVSGSHGGANVGEITLRYAPSLAVFNDAGIGKDRAGVIALDILGEQGIPALAVSHQSARIGDAGDMWENGIISTLNSVAERLGFKAGAKLSEAVGAFGEQIVQARPAV
ncbi:hypothetical protein E2A64_11605 [Pseudohoeflea suaedae]|uniref:Uncharacterized protein n=1 Tax=Pseudohoeflea suaedae TaxID=877384 RepID=A0A4R5PKV2_9HYPH|nr:hypothetical protein [Pseudohoeflea suaedae]TDH35948.1 hypothetical protein E2A64_11605 [Pseudohoeflea suaedae]